MQGVVIIIPQSLKKSDILKGKKFLHGDFHYKVFYIESFTKKLFDLSPYSVDYKPTKVCYEWF